MRSLEFFLIVALTLAIAPVQANTRLALVIGNRDYTAGALKNPINDAVSVGDSLSALGFQVSLVKNLKRDDIGRTMERFMTRIRPGDDVVVFYAGHGLQVKGVNYLPAVDANIHVESDVALNSLNLSQLLDRLDEAKAGVRLLLIDACRDNPYSRSFRSSARGLARVDEAPSGTLMHFATRPGGIAADGTGRNGLYTAQLIKHLSTPGLSVESMLKRVAASVKQISGGDQQPWTEGALEGEFYFVQSGVTVPAMISQVQSASGQPDAKPVQQKSSVNIQTNNNYKAGQIIKDCPECPDMVVVPSGIFEMGSNSSDNERPVHTVTIGEVFALAKTEVTQGQWRSLMGSNPSHFSKCGDDCPVEQVSWNDAQDYVRKLSQKTGKRYRLPSESEWEYACFAGSRNTYCGGESVDEVAWWNSVGGNAGDITTHPVSIKKANLFGLNDLSGNVWEWTEDCWNDDFRGAPSDGSPWISGDCRARVIHGGSWKYSLPRLAPAAMRVGVDQTLRYDYLGFRPARRVE